MRVKADVHRRGRSSVWPGVEGSNLIGLFLAFNRESVFIEKPYV